MSDLKVLQPAGTWRHDLPLSAGIRAGDTIWLAGKVPVNLDTGKSVGGGIAQQTEQTIDNIAAHLKQEGCGLDRVVRCTVYLVSGADFAPFNAVYQRKFKAPFPARSVIIVAALADPTFLIEIDAIAVAPPQGNRQ